jgi:hypothetical protein
MFYLFKHNTDTDWAIVQAHATSDLDLSQFTKIGSASSNEFMIQFVRTIIVTTPSSNIATLRRLFERAKNTKIHVDIVDD